MRVIAAALCCSCLWAADPAWLAASGGAITHDKQGRIIALDLRSTWVSDSDLGQLAQLPLLSKLDLSLTRISDHGMKDLTPAPAIEELNLYYAEQVTDEGMAAVTGDEVRLTRKGLLRADTLLPRFFEPEHRGIRYT